MFIDDILLYNMLYIHDFYVFVIVKVSKSKKVFENLLTTGKIYVRIIKLSDVSEWKVQGRTECELNKSSPEES